MPHCPHLGRDNPEEESLLSDRGPQWDRAHHAARNGHLLGPHLLPSLSHFQLFLGSSPKEQLGLPTCLKLCFWENMASRPALLAPWGPV